METPEEPIKPSDDAGTLFGRYRVLRPLTSGGMAQILLAADPLTGQQVVLKRILPHLAENPDFVRFFIHEGRLGQRLRHPNLVETLEAGQVGPIPYIALEYLRGRPAIELLRAAAKKKMEIPLGVAVRIVADAARGLHSAHITCDNEGKPLGVIHRDVSPHNLFVCADGMTKVLDFGIAKASSQLHHTRTGTIKGKYAYLAPEQIKGEEIDRRVDVFALGIVLWELLTLKPLFRGKSDAEMLQKVLTLEVQAPEKVRAGVPAGLSAVCLRALQRDRDRRLPSAEALADSIEAVASAEGIDTSRPSVMNSLKELCPEILEELGMGELLVAETAPVRSRTVSGETETTKPGEFPAASSDPTLVPSPTRPTKSAMTPTVPSGIELVSLHRRRMWATLTLGVVAACSIGVVRFWRGSAQESSAIVLAAHPSEPTTATTTATTTTTAPATPTAPAKPQTATLKVKTDGNATFTVDGAPLAAQSGALTLAPGRHRVVVTASTLSEPRTYDVDLAPGEMQMRNARPTPGHLRLAVVPWAEVSVDGKSFGTTPLKAIELAEGPHVVTLKNDEMHVTQKQRVVVNPNRETLLKINLFK